MQARPPNGRRIRWLEFKSFLRDESGVTAIESALIANLIAVFIIVAVQFIRHAGQCAHRSGNSLKSARGAGKSGADDKAGGRFTPRRRPRSDDMAQPRSLPFRGPIRPSVIVGGDARTEVGGALVPAGRTNSPRIEIRSFQSVCRGTCKAA
jgi:hypothetical protein